MLNKYLNQISNLVQMGELEYNNSMKIATKFITILKSILPEFKTIEIYGSMSRRTCLSKNIDNNVDIDVFLIYSHESYKKKTQNNKTISGEFDDDGLNVLSEKIKADSQ